MCKHGLGEGTCWLCMGKEQEEAGNPRNFGVPPWFINLSQLTMQISYIARRKKANDLQDLRELPPKGDPDKNDLTSLPYRKRFRDPKTTHQYSISISKKARKEGGR